MQQQARALQVPQEQVAQARPIGSTLDQPRQVGHHEALLRPHPHDTQVGVQGGERVVRNARARIRDGSDQCGFASIGHPQQAHIGQNLQLQLEVALFTWPTRCFLAGRTVDGTLEAQIAKTTIAPFGNGDDLARGEQFKQDFARFRIGDDGAHRHFEHDVLTCRTEHVRAHAMLSALGLVTAGITKIDQGVQVGVRHGENMPAPATVPPIGAPELLVLLMTERDAAVPAIPCSDIDIGFVNKLHGVSRLQSGPAACKARSRSDFRR